VGEETGIPYSLKAASSFRFLNFMEVMTATADLGTMVLMTVVYCQKLHLFGETPLESPDDTTQVRCYH
jgi:hypothetical protein